MERREFIKAVGLALALPVVAQERRTLTVKGKDVVTSAEHPYTPEGPFKPEYPQGISLEFSDRSEAGVAAARKSITEAARKFLPKGTKFYVLDGGTHRVYAGDGVKEVDLIAWFYAPSPQVVPPSLFSKVIAEVTA